MRSDTFPEEVGRVGDNPRPALGEAKGPRVAEAEGPMSRTREATRVPRSLDALVLDRVDASHSGIRARSDEPLDTERVPGLSARCDCQADRGRMASGEAVHHLCGRTASIAPGRTIAIRTRWPMKMATSSTRSQLPRTSSPPIPSSPLAARERPRRPRSPTRSRRNSNSGQRRNVTGCASVPDRVAQRIELDVSRERRCAVPDELHWRSRPSATRRRRRWRPTPRSSSTT